MTPYERLMKALNHEEPDRIPLDFGATGVTTINVIAYERLCQTLGIRDPEVKLLSLAGQFVDVPESILNHLNVDVRGVRPGPPSTWKCEIRDEGEYVSYADEWGVIRYKPKHNGLYFDTVAHPLEADSGDLLVKYRWPNPRDPGRLQGLKDRVVRHRDNGFPVIVSATIGNGFLQTGCFLRGYDNFFCDLVLNRKYAEAIIDKVLELKLDYWDMILDQLGEHIQIVLEQDDLGTQSGPLISPEMYRSLIKPRQMQLFSFIKRRAPGVKIFFHSCGSVYRFIPDLVEVGVDILNPIQTNAAEMCTKRLKREFGKDLVFWGGGIDTQVTLPKGTQAEIADEVRRRIDDLAPGGGFVFATVHSVQSDVPPENLICMWNAFKDNSSY